MITYSIGCCTRSTAFIFIQPQISLIFVLSFTRCLTAQLIKLDLALCCFRCLLSPCLRWVDTCAAKWFCTGPASAPGSEQTPIHSQTSWPGWPDVCSEWPRHWGSWRSGPSPPIGFSHHSTGLRQSSYPEDRETEHVRVYYSCLLFFISCVSDTQAQCELTRYEHNTYINDEQQH